jgi:hypothetical protein
MRQTRRSATLTVTPLLALALACGEPEVTAPPDAHLARVQAVLGGAGRSSTGGGVVDLTTAGAGFMHFSFGAVVTPHGNANGTFRQVREVGGLLVDFAGEVTCLSVDATTGRAWIAGVVTRNNSTHPGFLTGIHEVGDDVWFRVVDYGEGANAAQRDRSTVLGFEGAAEILTSEEYCAVKPWPDADARTFPVSEGNIQVRP